MGVCVHKKRGREKKKHLTCSLSVFPFRIFSSDLTRCGFLLLQRPHSLTLCSYTQALQKSI